ncbi:MAG: hypothetical protein G01um101472_408 [Parcubacteria group bacterium Gr01-1014_72]|nr:MAG: hypothetical protein G01um101472_408 [Parcubacteria group bacterium Gr01-1014_72]
MFRPREPAGEKHADFCHKTFQAYIFKIGGTDE